MPGVLFAHEETDFRCRPRNHVTVAATPATIHAVVVVVLAVVVCAVTVHVFVVATLTAVFVLTVAVVFAAVAVLTTTTGLTCSVLAATVVLIVTIVVKSPVVSWSCLTVYPPRPQLLGSQRFKGAPARPAMSLAGAPGVGGEAVQAPGSASAQAVGSALPESTAGFVELSPVHAKKPWDFYEALSADRAVSSVVHSSTSSSQGWAGDDNVEQSLLVYVEGFPNDPVEFELARSEGELPSPARSSTVVARFKPPPKGMECMAWQILTRVVEGKELMPDWARRYAQAATKRAKQRLAEESAVGGTGATRLGSASHTGPAPQEPPLEKNRPQAGGVSPTEPPWKKRKVELPWRESKVEPPWGGSKVEPPWRESKAEPPWKKSKAGPPWNKIKEEPSSEPGDASSQLPAFWRQDEEPPDWPADSGLASSACAEDELAQPVAEDGDILRRRRAAYVSTFLGFNDLSGIEPGFAEAVQQRGMAEDPRFEAARALQTNVVEHVRWRPTDTVDPASRDCIDHMRAILRDTNRDAARRGEYVPDTWDMFRGRVPRPHYLHRPGPGTASVGDLPRVSPRDFLEQAAKRSLQVVAFKKSTAGEESATQALRDKYSKLFEELPATTAQKFRSRQLNSADDRARAVVQLATALHAGEVAELDPDCTRWHLVAKAPGSASAPQDSPQFYCAPSGAPVLRPPEQCYEFGRPPLQAAGWSRFDYAGARTRSEIARLQRLLGGKRKRDHSDYEPDWPRQRHRCVVPCANAAEYEWVRTGEVVTLGELFMRLGEQFTCRKIYAFFRTLRLVALKRDKAATRAAPGSASAGSRPKVVGVTGGPLQASRIQSEFRKQDALVAEYVDLKGLTAEYVNEKGHALILREAINLKAAPTPPAPFLKPRKTC